MKSVMQHLFSQVPSVEVPRSVFDRSSGLKTAIDVDFLVPIFADEVLPGDTFTLKPTLFGRLTTPIVPIMDNLWLDQFYFFVPNRLVWENWQRFCGERPNPDDSIDFVLPTISAPEGGFAVNSVFDYMGIPPGIENIEVNALPFRAINLIYNEWFRDQNLIDRVAQLNDDGPDPDTAYGLFHRGKRHDYFTSCLPWPQKGDSVMLSLSGTAPVWGNGEALVFEDSHSYFQIAGRSDTDAAGAGDIYASVYNAGANIGQAAGAKLNGWNQLVSIRRANGDPASMAQLQADMSQVSANTINEIREAFQLQRMLERDARGGTRYRELIQSHFGVRSDDARLQRPEVLSVASQRIAINAVQQTSASNEAGTPQGNLAAFGQVAMQGGGFSKSFTEHGYIIGFACVRADLTYQQGINRMFSREGRYDFYWPSLAHLGEQVVYNREIYAQGTAADAQPFGFQERFAEYRYKPSMITGKMRSNPVTPSESLDVWHLSEEFGSLPALNGTFIHQNTPIERVLAVTDEPHLRLDGYFELKCARAMPVYSVPGLIDHF